LFVCLFFSHNDLVGFFWVNDNTVVSEMSFVVDGMLAEGQITLLGGDIMCNNASRLGLGDS